ncbi:MAG: tellurite resistance TerB family protein [Burkholderiales bacterium]|nr:tellurite resistance TerB family protein [Burkholderiales bacterium]
MSMQSLLDQLLRSGLGGMGGALRSGARGRDGAPGGSDLGKLATGAAAGGALALLLGSKRGRRVGGSVLKYGTVAALGAVAWRVYQDWEARQAAGTTAGAPAAKTAQPAPATPDSFALLPAPQLESHSQAMLKAMISAAKADGHMDDRERELVQAELHRLEADPALRGWVDAELRRPVEPAEVAAAATGPEMAAEIYLASVLVADETTTMERAYLDALAAALKLPPELRSELDARARDGR